MQDCNYVEFANPLGDSTRGDRAAKLKLFVIWHEEIFKNCICGKSSSPCRSRQPSRRLKCHPRFKRASVISFMNNGRLCRFRELYEFFEVLWHDSCEGPAR